MRLNKRVMIILSLTKKSKTREEIMKKKIKYALLITFLLSNFLGVIPMGLAYPIDPPDDGGTYMYTLWATYKYDMEGGFWVETSLYVFIHYSPNGISFSYSMSHRESKPWYASWVSGDVELYQVRSGLWVASNYRTIFVWFGFFSAMISVRIYFYEDTMTFSAYIVAYSMGALVFEAWVDAFGPN